MPASLWYWLGMYLRTTSSRPRKDGSQVRYLQLAHNEWDPEAGQSVAKLIHSFGREDQVDREALARLVRSISRCSNPTSNSLRRPGASCRLSVRPVRNIGTNCHGKPGPPGGV